MAARRISARAARATLMWYEVYESYELSECMWMPLQMHVESVAVAKEREKSEAVVGAFQMNQSPLSVCLSPSLWNRIVCT